MGSMQKKYSSVLGLLCTILLFAAIIGCFRGDTYIVKGNLHDLWIPQLGAYAIKTGAVLHHEFHTFFGLFYNGLNYVSLILTENFPDIFMPSDMIMLSSSLFAIVIVGLCFLIKINTKRRKCIPWFVFLLIISHIFQSRQMLRLLDYKYILWYGSYNYHMWSLLLLQAVHIFACLGRIRRWKMTNRDLLLFSLVQTICAFIAFNYKMSFFGSSALMAASIFLLLPNRAKIIYASTSIILFISFGITVALTSGYSYMGYFNDVLHASEAREMIGLEKKLEFVIYYCLVFFIIQYRKLLFSGHFLRHLVHNRPELSKDAFFYMFMGLAIFVGMAGDWQVNGAIYLIFLMLYAVIDIDNRLIRNISYTLLSILFFINTISLIYVAQKKTYTEKKYRAIDLMSEKPDFLIDNRVDIDGLYTKFYTDMVPSEEAFLNLSYTANNLPFSTPFFNAEYYYMVKDSIARIREISDNPDDVFMRTEFINPLPLLLKSKIPPGTYHWIHFGATFSLTKQLHKIHAMFMESDFVYMPVLSIDRIKHFMNCLFYEWNFENGRFKFYSINRYGLLFIENSTMEAYGLTPSGLVEQRRDGIEKRCKDIRASYGL